MTTLADLTVPGPTSIPLTEPFWDGAAEGRLRVQRCQSCGAHIFYPRNRCSACWSADLEWVDCNGGATLMSFSEVWKPGHPGWLAAAPYYVGIVQLREGPTLLTHVLSKARRPRIGASLFFAPTDVGGRVLPCFENLDNE